MSRIPRILITGAPTAYHVMSRTALPGYPIGDIEKDYFVRQVKTLSRLYFTDVLGFCCMGNHFHLLVRMLPDTKFTDDELKTRLAAFYNKDATSISDGQLPSYREKLSNLSEFVREIKLRFTRFYNKRHNRKGYFWGDRFKSVVVENGDTLIIGSVHIQGAGHEDVSLLPQLPCNKEDEPIRKARRVLNFDDTNDFFSNKLSHPTGWKNRMLLH